MKIVYATTNPGKLEEAKRIYAHHGLTVMGLNELGVEQDVEETGNILEENAAIKANAYLKLVPSGTIVVADDTGIEIDALGGEPGIKVRRWLGHKMTDEEIIEHCLRRMKNIPIGKRQARFRTVLAVTVGDSKIKYFDGILDGEILIEPKSARREGMPFWPLFYVPELKMTLGEFHASPLNFQMSHPTHREKALVATVSYLKSLVHQASRN